MFVKEGDVGGVELLSSSRRESNFGVRLRVFSNSSCRSKPFTLNKTKLTSFIAHSHSHSF